MSKRIKLVEFITMGGFVGGVSSKNAFGQQKEEKLNESLGSDLHLTFNELSKLIDKASKLADIGRVEKHEIHRRIVELEKYAQKIFGDKLGAW